MITDPVAGALLDQRFVIDCKVGAGGMGTVFRARDQRTGQTVAVKLLQPHGAPQEAERFARESQILAELQHPHIVSYVANGLTGTGQPYLAMEWLEGEDLAQYLSRRRPSFSECVALLHGTSAALAEAHQRGIIHRDLKPGNLFLRDAQPDCVVMLDFGIARRMMRGGGLTRTGVVIGTPEYMAPEQARGEHDIGPPTDIFSLGCVLFECLTGRSPFIGEHAAAVLVRVLFEEPPILETLRAEVPTGLSSLLRRMLHKDPRQRFPNGLALHEAIRRLELPAGELPGLSAPTMPALATLTLQEQQIFSVAVAVHRTDETALATQLPSENAEHLARHKTLQEALRKLGVSVELLADGSLVATVFPSASASDQALLAARCGLLMKERLPEAEVAVATGRGLLRSQVPIGDAIDRALHLLKPSDPATAPASPSNSVWLDALTENLLSGRLHVTHHGGHAQLLREQDPTAGDEARLLLGHPTPCVGREQELATLESVLSTCVADSVARAVGVVAPPGIGKSRLRHEFLRSASQHYPQLVVLLGRGDPMNAGSSYSILGQAVRRLCGIIGGELASIQQQRLGQRLGLHLAKTPASAGRIISFMGELCGVRLPSEGNRALQAARSDPKVMHEQVTQTFLDWLRAECETAPLLLVLEDLQWGDALTVRLLEQALAELAELPLCILALARPEVQEMFPSFWNARCIQELPLRRLSRRAAERLAQDMLRRAFGGVADGHTVARIVEQGAGNPLFLEELIRAVAEGRGDTLPETVLAMLLARLSQLDSGARQVLRAASVFGETFNRAEVAALLVGDSPTGGVDSSLTALVRAELIERARECREAETGRYKFRHDLVRDAAYSLLTDENRAVAHRLAGAYLEQLDGVGPAILAEHAKKAAELDRAARFFVEAAKQALSSYNNDTARRYAQQALDCGISGTQRGIVRAIQALTAHFEMDLATAYTHALEAVENLPPGSYWWAKAMGICFYSFFMINRFEDIERLIQSFMQATPEPDARVASLEAGHALSIFFTNAGQRRAAAVAIHKMSLAATDLDPEDQGCLLLADAARSARLEPDLFQAAKNARRAAELFTNNGDSLNQSLALFYLGTVYTALGSLAAGEQALREGMIIATRAHELFRTVVIHLHLGFNLARQPIAAKQEEARRISAAYIEQVQMGPAVRGASHKILGQVLMTAGDLAGAESAFQTSMEAFSGMLPHRLEVVPLQVELFLQQGRVAEARRMAEDGMRLLEEQGGLGSCELPIRLAVTLTRFAAGDSDAAQSALADALSQLRLRADLIEDQVLRQSFLTTPENRQLRDLAQTHGLSYYAVPSPDCA